MNAARPARAPGVLAVCSALVWALPATVAVPDDGVVKLSIDDPVHEWGSVYQGQSVKHSFRLRNEGASAVKIREIRTRCSCTFAGEDAAGKVLEPGETVRVSLRLETGMLPADQIRKPGLVRKSGEIVTADNRTAGVIWLQGTIRELLRFEPERAGLEVVRDDDDRGPPPVKVRAVSQIAKPIAIRRIRGPKKIVAADLEEKEAGRVFEISVRSLVPVTTDDPRQADTLELTAVVEGMEVKLGLPVSVHIRRRIEVDPSPSFFFPKRLSARLGNPDEPAPTRVLTVRSIGSPRHRFRIKSVKTENGRFRTRLDTIEKGRAYRLTIELLPPPPDAGRLVRDKIHIETDDPLVPRITIPGIAQI